MPRKLPGDTEPYEQLINEEEVEAAHKVREARQRKDKREYQHRPHRSMQEGPERPARNFAADSPDYSFDSSHEQPMSIIDFLIPPIHATPEHIRRYRMAVSITITFVLFALGAAWGLFEKIGISGFARADRIEAVAKPLELKINNQTAVLETVSRQLTDQLAAGTAAEIRSNTAKRCLETSREERERINREIERLQNQYWDFKKFRYTAPLCAEL